MALFGSLPRPQTASPSRTMSAHPRQDDHEINFHGLRDFYHLIRAICAPMKPDEPFKQKTILKAISRNAASNASRMTMRSSPI